jgi:uncharacterized protein YuzE
MDIYIQKDKAADQLYVGFGRRASTRRGAVKRTVRVTESIAVDLDASGRLVGIDIHHASKVLGRGAFAEGVAGDELLGVLPTSPASPSLWPISRVAASGFDLASRLFSRGQIVLGSSVTSPSPRSV